MDRIPVFPNHQRQQFVKIATMYFKTEKLNLKKIIFVITDGAPAMVWHSSRSLFKN